MTDKNNKSGNEFSKAAGGKKPATVAGYDNGRDAYGRDTRGWITVNGKDRPHP